MCVRGSPYVTPAAGLTITHRWSLESLGISGRRWRSVVVITVAALAKLALPPTPKIETHRRRRPAANP